VVCSAGTSSAGSLGNVYVGGNCKNIIAANQWRQDRHAKVCGLKTNSVEASSKLTEYGLSVIPGTVQLFARRNAESALISLF
jgi:hypothetical protein